METRSAHAGEASNLRSAGQYRIFASGVLSVLLDYMPPKGSLLKVLTLPCKLLFILQVQTWPLGHRRIGRIYDTDRCFWHFSCIANRGRRIS